MRLEEIEGIVRTLCRNHRLGGRIDFVFRHFPVSCAAARPWSEVRLVVRWLYNGALKEAWSTFCVDHQHIAYARAQNEIVDCIGYIVREALHELNRQCPGDEDWRLASELLPDGSVRLPTIQWLSPWRRVNNFGEYFDFYPLPAMPEHRAGKLTPEQEEKLKEADELVKLVNAAGGTITDYSIRFDAEGKFKKRS